MENLPFEGLFQIALNLDVNTLLNFFAVCKKFRVIYDSDFFWKQKILHDFPYVIIEDFDEPLMTYLDIHVNELLNEAEYIRNSYRLDPLYFYRQKQVIELKKDLKYIQTSSSTIM